MLMNTKKNQMKTKVHVLVLALLTSSLYAQEKDTTQVQFNNMTITFNNNDEDSDEEEDQDIHLWRGLEFGVTGYFMDDAFGINNDPDNSFMELNYGRSFTFNWNIAEYSVPIGTEKFRFTTGLGFRFGRYAFKNTNTTLRFDDNEVYPTVDSTKTFDKNFMNTTYLNAPFMLSIIPGNDFEKSFHFSVGAIVNYRLGSRIKQVYELDGQKRKDINRGHYHLSPFLLDATARIGVGDFQLFANYSLTPLFEKNKGPEYFPFSVGVSLGI